MNLLAHAVRLVAREPRRSLAAATGVGIAAALLVSVMLFGTASGATVTGRALAALPVDAQVVLAEGADPAAVARLVSADPAVRSVLPFELVHFDRATSSSGGSATETSVGALVGLDPAYASSTGLFGISQGVLASGGVAVSRDLATNLGITPGSRAGFTLPGGATVDLQVSGIVDISGADLLLGPSDAAHRAAGANAPVNVAVVDRATLDGIAARIPAGAPAAEPVTAAGGQAGTTPVSAAEPAVRRELQVRYDRGQIPGDPVAAQAWLDTVRRRLEAAGAGTFQVVDDATASLEPIVADLVWGQVLFIFLALPGIVLALALTRLALDATADATRRHAALLRARGASPSQLRGAFVAAAAATAVIGSLAGGAAGTLIAFVLLRNQLATVDPVGTVVRTNLLAVAVLGVVATAAAVFPLRDQLSGEVAEGRQELGRVRSPLWRRLGLDVVALAAAVVAFVVAGANGARPVLTAEGNPTVSIALTAFAAPLLLWIGGTLLLLRLAGPTMAGGRRLRRILRRLLGPGGELSASTLAARATAASRAVVVLALSVSFATSILVFNATYVQQQRVDASLTLGADLKAVPNGAARTVTTAALEGPGIAAVSPVVDRVVYVGTEAQDIIAVDPTSFAATAPLSDSFFQGTTAKDAMAALDANPDGILVSSETAKDYSIVPGDRVRIRVPDASGALRSVDFRMVGVALEFPTAPHDAFLVANLSYVAAQTGDSRFSFVLARATGDARAASGSLARRLGDGWQVTDVGTTNARLANSITSVDLANLVVLDVGFAVLIASVGLGLFLLAGLSERRRELATMQAIGAAPSHLRALVAAETLVVTTTGLVAGLVIGGLVGVTLLQVLAGVFDPPADLPVVPLLDICGLIVAVGAGVVAAGAVGDRGLARLQTLSVLRER
jgi:putative ABC transport system permease protein